MLARVLAALAVVLTLTFADQSGANASPLANGCAGGVLHPRGGCIHLVGDGLYVKTLQPGLSSHNDNTFCGFFKVSQRNVGGAEFVIHTSAWRCVIPSEAPWGPTYDQFKRYLAGTRFCGWFTGYLPDEKGCVELAP